MECVWRSPRQPHGNQLLDHHNATDRDALPERRILRDVGKIEGGFEREASDPAHPGRVLGHEAA